MLMREKLEICPVWGKLQIKFPVRTKETEAIMVLYILYNNVIFVRDIFYNNVTFFVLTRCGVICDLLQYTRKDRTDFRG